MESEEGHAGDHSIEAMNENRKKIVILGAGAAGLSAAWKLLREDPRLHVVLIERDPLPGGLAKSISWKGYALDLGPHRFYTEIPEVKQFIKSFCEERMIQVTRASRMYLNGRYIPYPIKPLPTFQALGLSNTLSFSLSALRVLWNKQSDAESYEDYVIGYYGEKLYRRIFQPYAEKVWGIPAAQITAETARVRLRGENIWHSLKDGLLSKHETYVAKFLYPPGGIGDIPQQFAQEIIRDGGEIKINHEVTGVSLNDGRVHEVEVSGPQGVQKLACDILINTAPLPQFAELMRPVPPADILSASASLHYRAITLLYLQYDEDLNINDTWLYFPEEHVPFSRIYVPDNFAPHKKQPGKTCLCVEFPCDVESDLWRMDAFQLADLADRILAPSGLIHRRSIDALVVRIKEGYPLYEIGYEHRVNKTLEYIRSMGNCLTTGRQGLFRHNNLDQSLQMGLQVAEHVLEQKDSDSWYDNIDRYKDYRIVD
ncbi:MAG: FAD-dependent oxidoreductase [Candidatus Omnitrophica bacterium]|nr:FAD-dependent oxidoreductase [Candidatus Omnitrophota bacterium]